MIINKILRDPSRHVGVEVEIEGVFVLGSGLCQLMENDYEEKINPIGISVRHGDIKKVLFRTVPAFGGGELAYRHAGILRGTFLYSEAGPFEYEITNLTYIMLQIDSAEFFAIK
jgi:hypothetical protein